MKKIFAFPPLLFFLFTSLCDPHSTAVQQSQESSADVNLFLNIAVGYLSLGLATDALDILTKLQASVPENLDVLLHRGIALCMKGDFNSASKDFKKIENSLEDQKRVGGPGTLRDTSGAFAFMARQKERAIFSPENAGLLDFWEGIELLKEKEDYKGAIKKFLSSRKKGYEDINARYLLVYSYAVSGRLEEADTELTRIWGTKEKEDIDYFLEGYLAYHRNKRREAISAFQKALEVNPDFAEARTNLACLYYNQRDWEKAIPLWESLVEMNPGDRESRLNLGRTYFHMGNHEEAKKHFSYLNEPFPEEKTIPSKISPAITSADRWFKFHISKPTALASLLKQGFDIQKIREMGIKPSLLFLFLNEQALFQLKSKGAVEGAIEILNQAIQLGNAPFYIFYNQGMLHYNQGNLQEARLYASLSIQQKDDFLDAHDLMGNVYFREGRYHEALSEFDKVVKISDTDPQGHYNLGCVCWALNEGDRAEEEWEKALLFESQKDSREKQGKFIVEGLNVSVLVQRKSVACRAHISLGSLYEKKGLMEDARREYEQAVEIAPTDPEAYFDLGRLHFERQSKERAIFYLQKHIDLGGHNQEKAKEMLKILKEQGY